MLQEITYNRKLKTYTLGDDPVNSYPDKRAARLARIRNEGGDELAARVEQLLARYPQLKDRPLTAGEMVAQYRVWPGLGVIARVERETGEMREVNFINEHFTCTCEDFIYNVKAIEVADGSYQSLCPHILAACLDGWEKWGGVLV